MDSFDIHYRITLRDDEDLDEKVESFCRELSVELPKGVVSETIKNNVVGSLKTKRKRSEDQFEVTVSWPLNNLGGEIPSFLNTLYGNISLQSGIRVTGAQWNALREIGLLEGPELGIQALRDRFAIQGRPLISTALKPLGLSPRELGDLCGDFARGGIDIIKDDDGLANQHYAPFRERVRACVDAVQEAEQQTGRRSFYFPHVTAGGKETLRRYETAAEMGADGVLLCPHIGGLPSMHELARHGASLPIIAHPTFSGEFTTHAETGFTPDFLYGQLWRALGADFSIFANTGGRFPITEQECVSLCDSARAEESPFRRTFPMPGGGMKLDTVGEWADVYGDDTVFLIGGSLYNHPDGHRKAAEKFRALVGGQ